ncbi:MAG TPA: phosphatase PAP2 family protein [Sphingomonas sp.]|jgi:hypothetical protein
MAGRLGREALFTGALLAFLTAYAALTLTLSGASFGVYLGLLADHLRIAASLWTLVALLATGVLLRRGRVRPDGSSPSRRPSLARLVGEELDRRWRRDRFLSLFTPPLLFAWLVATFNLFKQRVLPQAGFPLDPALAGLDRLLFGGVDAWRVTHGLIPSPWATLAIDMLYHGWFLPMSLGVMICAFLPTTADRLRMRYLLSFVAIWVLLGSGMASVLASAGPCFQPTAIGLASGFEPLLARLDAQDAWVAARLSGGGLSALDFQRGLLALHSSGRELAVGGGISAMPSIHNALAALFAMAAFQLDRRAGWAMTAYAGLIWVGSVHLGWHYAVDGPVAVAATAAIWRMSGGVADLLLAGPAGVVPRRAQA